MERHKDGKIVVIAGMSCQCPAVFVHSVEMLRYVRRDVGFDIIYAPVFVIIIPFVPWAPYS